MSKLKALVVDDEQDICEFLKERLESMGLEVFGVFSGDKAMEIMEQHELQFALVDLKLASALTGIDVLRAIRKKYPTAVLIAMSGFVDIALRQETGRLGVDAYFSKPDDVRPELFENKVRELMGKKGWNIPEV